MPVAIDFVHSLEHGRLEIQYSPDLPEADQLALKGLYDTMYGATLLFPNDKMPYQVAATTWTNLLGCKKYEGGDHAGRDPRLRQGDLGQVRRRDRPAPSPSPARLRKTRSRRPVGGEEVALLAARA